MNIWEPNILAIPLLYASVLCLGLGYSFWQERQKTIIRICFYIAMCLTLWSIGEFGQQGSQSITSRIFWTTFNLTVVPFIPPLFFILILHYIGRENWLNQYTYSGLGLIILIDLIAIWSNPQHNLYYKSITMDGYVRGPIFYIHVIYIYAVSLFFNLLFLHFMVTNKKASLPNILLQIGFAVPLTLNILVIANVFPRPSPIDWTPLVFSLGLALITFALYQGGVLSTPHAAQQTIVQNMSTPIFVLDKNGMLVHMNQHGQQLAQQIIYPKLGIGFSAKTLLNRPISAQESSNKASLETYELELIGTDTKRCVYEARLSPLLTHGAHADGYIIILRDISEQKQTITDMHMQKEMAQQAILAAREANAFKSRLIARVSHEFRTPVSAVIGMSGMLNAHVGGELSDKQAEINGRIMNNARRLSKLIDNLLDQSRLEEDELQLNQGICNPNKLLLEFISEAEQDARDKGLQFEWQIPSTVSPFIYCDPDRFKQAVTNVLDNAIKFTNQGSISANVTISEHQWSVAIKDSGIGLTEEAQQSIFVPFRQVDDTISRSFTGSGLGLSIAKQLIERMSGEIHVTSEVDVGSVFTIRFPIAQVEVPQL